MELPRDPWAILELDRTSATERDVKRAYARLIKVYRPDVSQEAFQRVHQAYQYALAELQHRDQQTEPAVDVIDSPAAPPILEKKPLPEDFTAALGELQLALHDPEAGSVSASFAKLRNLAVQRPSLLPDWEYAMLSLFSGQEMLLGQLLDVEDVFCLIQYEQTDLANLAIDRWHAAGLTLRLAQLGSKCGSHTPPLDAPAVVLLQMRLAMLVAFINLSVANRLSNLFYPKLAPHVRDWVMPRVENRLSAAKIFEILPIENRRFWEHRMFPDDETVEWSVDVVGPKFRDVLVRCPSSWPGYAILQSMMPQVIFDQLVQKYRPSLQSSAVPQASYVPREEKQSAFRIYWIILVLGFMAFRGVSGCLSSVSPRDRSSYPTHGSDAIKEIKERMREREKSGSEKKLPPSVDSKNDNWLKDMGLERETTTPPPDVLRP